MGLALLGEPMAGVQSAAMTFLTPAGNARQPEQQLGVAPMLAELMGRGAGGLSSRPHSDALDDLGVHGSLSNGNRHLRLGAVLVGDKLLDALPLLLDQALKPNLDASELEPSRDLCLQEIDALEDDPQARVMIDLRSRHYPTPLGRPGVGVREHLKAMTLRPHPRVLEKHHHARRLDPFRRRKHRLGSDRPMCRRTHPSMDRQLRRNKITR